MKDCQLLKDEQNKEKPQQSNARVFSIIQAKVDTDTYVVWGKILIARILLMQ